MTTTGALPDAYSEAGVHGHDFEAFVPAVRQTARFCGMNFLPPIVVYASHALADVDLHQHAQGYRDKLTRWMAAHG